MKKIIIALFILALATPAFSFQCNNSQVAGEGEQCYTPVTVASNETTLVSKGTVLVFDTANAEFNADTGAFQVRVATASTDGAKVAGIAQRSIVTGDQALVLVRGKGYVYLKNDSITSGDGLYVASSGDVTKLDPSNSRDSVGFALETVAGSSGTHQVKKAYITR